MDLKISKFGRNLCSRDIGEKVRAELLDLVEHGENNVTISFDEIFMLTSSFADEAFGKLIAGIGFDNFNKTFEIKEIENSHIKSILTRSIKQRLLMANTK